MLAKLQGSSSKDMVTVTRYGYCGSCPHSGCQTSLSSVIERWMSWLPHHLKLDSGKQLLPHITFFQIKVHMGASDWRCQNHMHAPQLQGSLGKEDWLPLWSLGEKNFVLGKSLPLPEKKKKILAGRKPDHYLLYTIFIQPLSGQVKFFTVKTETQYSPAMKLAMCPVLCGSLHVWKR